MRPSDAGDQAPGLWATVEWNQPAREKLSTREYRYLSPVVGLEFPEAEVEETEDETVISFPKGLPVVVELINAALTNDPAIDGMVPVAASRIMDAALAAQTSAGHGANKENRMSELKELGFDSVEQARQALADLRSRAEQATALETQLATTTARVEELEQSIHAKEVDNALALARANGRVTETNEAFARELAEKDLGLFDKWVKEGPATPEAPEGRLTLSRRASETTVTTPLKDADPSRMDTHGRVLAYQREHKVSYGDAYEAVGKEL